MAEEYIEMRSNDIRGAEQLKVAFQGQKPQHLYLVYHDKEGRECFLRGGPGGSEASELARNVSQGKWSEAGQGLKETAANLTPEKAQELLRQGAFGKIDTEICWRGPQGARQPVDYHEGQNPQRWELMRGDGCEKKFQQLCQQVDAIKRSETPYNPLGPNSNTTVTVACKNCGLDPKLPEKHCAPGAGMDIDLSKVPKRAPSEIIPPAPQPVHTAPGGPPKRPGAGTGGDHGPPPPRPGTGGAPGGPPDRGRPPDSGPSQPPSRRR